MSESVIEVRGLRKLRLRDVSLRVDAGERVAIVGRSGEGKTVLLRSILGLLAPEAGEVRLLGGSPRSVAGDLPGLGVAFQNPGLFDAWSIRQNLAAAAAGPISDDQLRSLLAEIGLGNISLDRSPKRLSGGQQKRVALIRAVLRGTRLLILDEPTSGLDPETAARVATFLEASTARSATAVLLITHDYETALRISSRVLLVTASGSLEEIDVDRSQPEQAERAIRETLRSQAAGSDDGTRDSLAWGTAAAAEDFVAQALPLSILTMVPLGAMMVAQTAGLVSIDISPRIPGGLVGAVFREIAPLVVGLLVSARVSSRVSAEVAGMSYTSQLDSMRMLGVSRMRMLIAPFVIAAALVFPLCIVAGGFAAVAGGSTLAAFGLRHLTIGAGRFVSLAIDALDPISLGACMVKGALMGIIVAALSYAIASRPIESASALGDAVTRSTVASAVCVIVVDIIVSWTLLS